MNKFILLFFESILFAIDALKQNILRTVLSLLGVSIGIFAIITVLTAVDGLHKSIRDSFSFIGDKVVYVEKWPWIFGGEYKWWEFINRPEANFKEFQLLEENLTWGTDVSMFASTRAITVKHANKSIEQMFMQGITYNYNKITEIKIDQGRYFTQSEIDHGLNKIIIGYNIVQELFPYNPNPIGEEVKIKGIKYTIIATLKKEGSNLFGFNRADNLCLIPYKKFTSIYSESSQSISRRIAINGLEGDKNLEQLQAEITGLMRRARNIKPSNDNTFAINRSKDFASFIDGIIAVLNIAGWFIGSFSILVGGFGIANIMFVSVRERTNIIGIQKSLGAKSYFILLQFLFEALFLSLIGGILGLFFTYLCSVAVNSMFESFALIVSLKNITIGLTISSIIGILSGIIPASIAAKMDPVTAIRSN